MTPRILRLPRRVASRLLRGRRLPFGTVARDRRLLRKVLRPATVGKVLVVGPSLAARQTLPGVPLDVAGTGAHVQDVNVCSSALGRGSLPASRWDTVVISAADGHLAKQLEAVKPACRPGALVIVMQGPRASEDAHQPALFGNFASVETLQTRGRRLRMARLAA